MNTKGTQRKPTQTQQEGQIFDMATAPLDRVPVYLHFEDGSKVRAYYRSTFEDGPRSWGTGPSFTHAVERTPVGWSPIPPTP